MAGAVDLQRCARWGHLLDQPSGCEPRNRIRRSACDCSHRGDVSGKSCIRQVAASRNDVGISDSGVWARWILCDRNALTPTEDGIPLAGTRCFTDDASAFGLRRYSAGTTPLNHRDLPPRDNGRVRVGATQCAGDTQPLLSSGFSAFAFALRVACVPTGMNAGVSPRFQASGSRF